MCIKNRKYYIYIISLSALSILTHYQATPTFAHTASITTSSSTALNVSPTGDGVSIQSESINVQSTCSSGYNLSVSTPEGSNLYAGGDSTGSASFTAVDGTSALNSSNNTNKWGYTLTTNATSSTVFSPLSATASVLKTASQTASDSAIDDNFNIYYGVKTDSSITPGSYQMANNGAIIYQLTMEPTCLLYTVQYQDNGADNPNGMGTTDASTGEKSVKQINIAEDTKITLLAPNFKKAGYAFLGWSTDQNAYAHFTDNDNTNDPVIYGPMEDVIIDATVAQAANTRNQINMYAVWIPALKDGSNNTVYMQEWDNPNTTLPRDGCSTLTATVFDDTVTDEKGKITATKDSVVALTDKRDDEVYTVARLADGNCWMVENLRLEHEGTVGNNKNDPTVTNQYLSQGYGGTTGVYGNFVGLAASESANFTDSIAANGIYESDGSGDTYNESTGTLEDIGTTSYPSYRFPRYNNSNNSSALSNPTFTENYANASSPSSSGSYKSSTVSSYGNYYTWAAAMASTSWYRLNSGTAGSENASTSICPSSWHLPSSSSTSKEYGTLSKSYGGTGGNQQGAGTGDILSKRFRSFPNNFLFSGYVNGSSNSSRGEQAYYWSRISRDGYYSESYSLSLNSTNLWPSYYQTNKSYGSSVRCLIGSSDVQIVLDSNNGTGAVSRAYGVEGSSVILPTADSFTDAQPSIAQLGYGFKNWNTAPDGTGTSYTSSYTIPSGSTGETLYAQWVPQYTITYVNNCMGWASEDSNCTTAKSASISTQKIDLNTSGNGSGTLEASNKFTLTGWKIKEWTTNADGTGAIYPTSSTYNVTGANPGDSITLYAHWVPVYSIQYDGNGADNPNGMGTTNATTGVKSVRQTNVSEGDPVTLLASNFKKASNGFAGWSTDPDAWTHFTDNDNTNDPVIYGPMETISAPAYPTNGANIITMYAVWVPAATSGGNPVYLQDWNSCSTLTSTTFDSATGTITASKNGIIALTDKRDDEVYTIAKLADDNCWMVENLRLEHEGTVGNNKNDSSVTNQSLSQGYGGTTGTYGNFIGLAASESANFSNSTTANSIYKSDGSGDTYNESISTLEDIGTTNYPGYRFPRYNNSNNSSALSSPTYTENYANTSSPSTSGTYKGSTVSSYGNYYTWAAAMANTNSYPSSSTSEAANTSICPSGWHLPTSGTASKEYGTLSQRYGGNGQSQSGTGTGDIMSNRFRTFPNNFLYSGDFSTSTAYARGSGGNYWSSTADYNYGTYYLYLNSSSVRPGSLSSSKYFGYSIRCLTSSS